MTREWRRIVVASASALTFFAAACYWLTLVVMRTWFRTPFFRLTGDLGKALAKLRFCPTEREFEHLEAVVIRRGDHPGRMAAEQGGVAVGGEPARVEYITAAARAKTP